MATGDLLAGPAATPVTSVDVLAEPHRAPRPALDATDERILRLLCDDGRMSMRALAERAGVSRAAAYARVQRLRTAGVIAGFSARVDVARLGILVTAHVLVTVDQLRGQEAVAALRAMPEVVYCAAVAAEHDLLLIVRAPDVDTLRRFVIDEINRMPDVRRTRTLLVLDDSTATDAHVLAAALSWSRARA